MRQGWEARRANGQFIRHVRLDEASDTGAYPFTLPVVASLAAGDGLDLDSSVTFLVGENGTGKSTLIEAIGTAAGFNPEGGSQSFRFATRATESSLGDHLILRWNRCSCARPSDTVPEGRKHVGHRTRRAEVDCVDSARARG